MNTFQPFDTWFFNGTKNLGDTIENAAAVDAGRYNDKPIVTIPINGHGIKANSSVYIEGTTNYNGLRYVQAVATNTINIYAKFVAETFAGIPSLSLLKSITRYLLLWPPPIYRIVIRPLLFLPPDFFSGWIKDFSGSALVIVSNALIILCL